MCVCVRACVRACVCVCMLYFSPPPPPPILLSSQLLFFCAPMCVCLFVGVGGVSVVLCVSMRYKTHCPICTCSGCWWVWVVTTKPWWWRSERARAPSSTCCWSDRPGRRGSSTVPPWTSPPSPSSRWLPPSPARGRSSSASPWPPEVSTVGSSRPPEVSLSGCGVLVLLLVGRRTRRRRVWWRKGGVFGPWCMCNACKVMRERYGVVCWCREGNKEESVLKKGRMIWAWCVCNANAWALWCCMLV